MQLTMSEFYLFTLVDDALSLIKRPAYLYPSNSHYVDSVPSDKQKLDVDTMNNKDCY